MWELRRQPGATPGTRAHAGCCFTIVQQRRGARCGQRRTGVCMVSVSRRCAPGQHRCDAGAAGSHGDLSREGRVAGGLERRARNGGAVSGGTRSAPWEGASECCALAPLLRHLVPALSSRDATRSRLECKSPRRRTPQQTGRPLRERRAGGRSSNVPRSTRGPVGPPGRARRRPPGQDGRQLRALQGTRRVGLPSRAEAEEQRQAPGVARRLGSAPGTAAGDRVSHLARTTQDQDGQTHTKSSRAAGQRP